METEKNGVNIFRVCTVVWFKMSVRVMDHQVSSAGAKNIYYWHKSKYVIKLKGLETSSCCRKASGHTQSKTVGR